MVLRPLRQDALINAALIDFSARGADIPSALGARGETPPLNPAFPCHAGSNAAGVDDDEAIGEVTPPPSPRHLRSRVGSGALIKSVISDNSIKII